VRVNFKDRRIFGPGITDHLIGRSPSQGFEMLGEIISGDEGQDMGLEAFEIVVVEDALRDELRGGTVQRLGEDDSGGTTSQDFPAGDRGWDGF
jgi:hypothetical protein